MRLVATLAMLIVIAGCATNSPALEPTSPYRLARLDHLRLLADCMTESGFPSTFNPVDESISVTCGVPTSQRDAVKEAQTACTRRIDPGRLEPPPLLTDEQWRAR